MAAPTTATTPEVPSVEVPPASKEKPETKMSDEQLKAERLATNQKMVQKYHSMFPKIPTMTSEELVARWKAIDILENERDDSQNSDSEDDDVVAPTIPEKDQPGPLLLIDVRSKAERAVSMIQGAQAMDDLETTRWINKYIHHFDGVPKGGTPTIVTYCTIGYRSGREAQWLSDELTKTYGIEIGKSVEIKNLDGILAYTFVEDAPPLLRPYHKGSSDHLLTRRIHSYGKEWSEAAHPHFEVVYFDKKPQKAKHLLQTGIFSAMRLVQHQIHKSTTKAKKTVVEPMAKMAGTSVISNDNAAARIPKRISHTGFTSNESTRSPEETDAH